VPGAASPHIEENLILDEVLTPGNPTIQVYNTIMYTTDQQSRQIKFIAAYCYDKRLLKNQCLCGISCGVEWHGDLFVIKQSGSRYVSLEDAGEIEVAKAAIGKYVCP
jgi:hypothetical protein